MIEPNANMLRHTPIKRSGRANGFTLLEVLVALVVLSIGLLGLAGLQVASLRYNHSAYLRSQATLLAYDILDRMRANRQEALSGAYTISLGTLPSAPTSCIGNASNCTPPMLATDDLYQWETELTNTLPGGTGSISDVKVAQSTQFTVTVQWIDHQTPGAPAQSTQQFVLMTEL